MGTRTTITFDDLPETAVYLHSLGEEEVRSIAAEVSTFAELPGDDPTYAVARFVGICCELCGLRRGFGVGVGSLDRMDDSGPRLRIDSNWGVWDR